MTHFYPIFFIISHVVYYQSSIIVHRCTAAVVTFFWGISLKMRRKKATSILTHTGGIDCLAFPSSSYRSKWSERRKRLEYHF